MDRDRGAVLQVGGSAQPVGATTLAEPPIMILPGRSTPLLRRCTALATRARVDLLVTSRPADCAELSEVLAELAAWEGGQLIDPDPTMLALAAAALQDLVERLDEPHLLAMGDTISAALGVLRSALS